MVRKTSWRDDARRLLNNRPHSLKLQTISEECGVSLAWLRMFARDQIPEPSVVSIETLTHFLKNYNSKG